MRTIERTPAESVARCNTPGSQHATPARCAKHPAQQSAQHSPGLDVKTLAKQALERSEARNGARNTGRNAADAGYCIGSEDAQHTAELSGRRAIALGGATISRNGRRSASMTADCLAPMRRLARWPIAWRAGAR